MLLIALLVLCKIWSGGRFDMLTPAADLMPAMLQFNRCMKGFNINIAQTWFDFGLAEDTQCKKIPVLSYNDVGVPGPLMISET